MMPVVATTELRTARHTSTNLNRYLLRVSKLFHWAAYVFGNLVMNRQPMGEVSLCESK